MANCTNNRAPEKIVMKTQSEGATGSRAAIASAWRDEDPVNPEELPQEWMEDH